MKNFIFGDTPFSKAIRLIADLIILNILWFICSLPILTMGPSTAALYYAVSAKSRGEEQMTRTFFRGFKRNFKPALIVWIMALAVGYMLYWNVTIVDGWETNRSIGLMVLGIPILLFIIILSYLFPLLAEFETKIPQLLSNSILLALAHFPRSLLIAFLNVLPLIILFLSPAWLLSAIFLWVPLGFSLCAYFIYRLLEPVFAPFRPEEDLED